MIHYTNLRLPTSEYSGPQSFFSISTTGLGKPWLPHWTLKTSLLNKTCRGSYSSAQTVLITTVHTPKAPNKEEESHPPGHEARPAPSQARAGAFARDARAPRSGAPRAREPRARGRREFAAGAWRALRLPLLSLVARWGRGGPRPARPAADPGPRRVASRAPTGARTHLLVVLAQPDPHRIQLGHCLRALPKLARRASVLPPINGQARGRRRASCARGAGRRPQPSAARRRGHRRRPSSPPPGPPRPSRRAPFAPARAAATAASRPRPANPLPARKPGPASSRDRRPNRRGHARTHAQHSRRARTSPLHPPVPPAPRTAYPLHLTAWASVPVAVSPVPVLNRYVVYICTVVLCHRLPPPGRKELV